MSGSRRSSSSGSRFQPLQQDVEDDDDSDSAEEMILSQEFYPTAAETAPGPSAAGPSAPRPSAPRPLAPRPSAPRSRSSSGSSAGEMLLSKDFYDGVALRDIPSSQRQRVSSRIFEIQPAMTEEPTGLDFQWDHYGRVPNLYDDVAVDALEDLFGQGSGQAATTGQTPVDIMEDLIILSDLGFQIDYPNGLLGQGSFGAVYLGSYGEHVTGGLVPTHPFAVKIVDFGNSTSSNISLMRESFENEKYILTTVNHRNIVTIRCIVNMGEIQSFPFSDNPSKFYLSPDRVYMIMDFADGGALHHYMHANRSRMEPSLRISFIRDVFFGMWYLHQNNIIHGDVHSGNVLIFKNVEGGAEELVAKWSDFGLGYAERNRQFQYKQRQMPQRHEAKYDIQGLHTIIHEILRARRQCRRETPEEKQRLNQCEDMADLMIRNVQSLLEVYNMYRDILEDELVFDEHHFS